MNRLDVAVQAVSTKEITSVLDVGCRDCSLQRRLKREVQYVGADLIQNNEGTVTFVGDITQLEISETFDCVFALDVLEHVADPDALFDKLVLLSSKAVVISLPNCYDLKGRLSFALKGSLGGKYVFDGNAQKDRHLWLMGRSEISRFFFMKAQQHALRLRIFDVLYGDPSSQRLSSRLRSIARVLPRNLSTATVIGLFEKVNVCA